MDMDWDFSPTTLKLMKIMRDFHRLNWGEGSVVGCKPSEIRVLFCIRHGKMKVSEISKVLQVTSPSVTQLLNGLEGRGLIERHMDPEDRRAVGINLTEKGNYVIKKAMESYKRSLDGLVAYLGEEDSEKLVELIGKVLRYYSEREERYGDEQGENMQKSNGLETNTHD